MDACVAPRYLWSFRVNRGQLRQPPPFVGSTRRERLWVEQEGLRPSRASAITPGGKDAITRHYTCGEVAYVLEGRAPVRHNDVGQQRVLRMDMATPLDGCYDWHAYIGYVFQNLNALIMDLAPPAEIGDVAERRPIDTDHEVPSPLPPP
jgi:hypothetical protein